MYHSNYFMEKEMSLIHHQEVLVNWKLVSSRNITLGRMDPISISTQSLVCWDVGIASL